MLKTVMVFLGLSGWSSLRAYAEVDYLKQRRPPVHGRAHFDHRDGGQTYQLTFQKSVRPHSPYYGRELIEIWEVDTHLLLTSAKGIDEITSVTVQPNLQGTAGVDLSLLQFDLLPRVDGRQQVILNRDAARVLRAVLAQDKSRVRDVTVTLNGMHGATHAVLKLNPEQVMRLMREFAPSPLRRACRDVLRTGGLTRRNLRRPSASY